ncbi:MAG: DUF4276 family protein [Alicyclobacillus sp.]|nr:DUF4276 family protein [Alicyclobacillus sp.]
MHLEFLVEELSAKMALRQLVPKIIGTNHTFEIHDFGSKYELLNRLESRMRGYAKMMSEWDMRIVVLVDEDRQNCMELKQRLVQAAVNAGIQDKTLLRIVVEELEAWFFGDLDALRAVYPRIPSSLGSQARYRNPDRIQGGTWEQLDRLLRQHGYSKGLVKTETAASVAEHMEPWRNKSKSFQVFRDGLMRLVQNVS